VPLLIGLRNGEGMPTGEHRAMVQTTDLAPTLLDLLDLRDRATRDADGLDRTGVSLEPLVHGWARAPVHEHVFFADRHHAAVRSDSWKLITPVQAPWHVVAERSQLFSLAEDPREEFDLAADRPLGPVGIELLQALRGQLARPETSGPR
jgi:arylsulfatase A-like enzyme